MTARASAYLETFGRLTTTAVTVFERRRGYHLAIREGKPFGSNLKAFEALVSACIVLPFDEEAAGIAAMIWAAVTRAHRQQLGDILIAAVAISKGLPLVTRNKKDFERLSKAAGGRLSLVDWTKAEAKVK